MMAVAMEVGWRGPELGSPSYSHLKHKAPPASTSSSSSWGGADPHKVLQLMMGQVHDESRPTLDLFGNASSSKAMEAGETQPDEFVELEPDLPLPSGWEKCLDLKSGKVYYVNRHTSAETYSDPRKQALMTPPDVQAPSASPQTRDFLGSKESENEKLGELSGRSPPSFSGREREREDSETSLFSSGGRDHWRHGWLGSGSLSDKLLHEVGATDSGLELKLNLHGKTQQSSVCTLEKVELALMRSEKMLGKRVASVNRSSPAQADQLLRSNHSAARVSPSPSTSSSSTSSRPSLVSYQLLDKENQNSNKRPAAAAAAAAAAAPAAVSPMTETEGDSAKEMVMVGGCKNCLMFVMLSRSNPMCPRCGTSAALDFSSPPANKRTKFECDRHD